MSGMDQRQPLKQSIFHCQSIGDAHEVSSSRIRRVGERTSTGSRTTHGQAAQLPGRTLCGDAVGGPLHGSGPTIVPRCRIRRRDNVSGRCGRPPSCNASRRFTASCRISSASVGIYCGRLTTGLLRARAFVERDAVTAAAERARGADLEGEECAVRTKLTMPLDGSRLSRLAAIVLNRTAGRWPTEPIWVPNFVDSRKASRDDGIDSNVTRGKGIRVHQGRCGEGVTFFTAAPCMAKASRI